MTAPPVGRTALIACVISALLGIAIGGVGGYAFGGSRVVHAIVGNHGWLLQTVQIDGNTIEHNEAIFLWWDVAQSAHNPQSDWFIAALVPEIPKTKPKTPTPTPVNKVVVTDNRVDALTTDQINVKITSAELNCLITGTLGTGVMILTIPPNCTLFPEQAPYFRTLTFTPSTFTAFNQFIAQEH
jgi:hypothetical protein